MAQLAIKGHPTRGNEVIELLEMLGAKNYCRLNGDKNNYFYYISDKYKDITNSYIGHEEYFMGYEIFSLEDFLDKFPYKVGDKVTYDGDKADIVGMVWDNDTNDVFYEIRVCDDVFKCPKVLLQPYKEETMEEKLEQIILEIPAGYEFFGINNDNKVVLTKKQLKYPQTYKECCEVIGLTGCMPTDNLWYKFGLILAFYQLFICRDAYWKIAGDWEPNWNEETDKFTISNKCNNIYLNNTAWYSEVLAFPTAEMRDAFYENFKDLIESCKELL